MHLEYFKKEILPLKDKLFRYTRSYVKDISLAEDILQEVFIKIWNKRNDFKKIRNIEAWTMTVTRNLVYDTLKARKNSWEDTSRINIESMEHNPGILLESKETSEEIRHMIDSLSDKQKEALILREIEGYTYQEMSEIMGIDTNLVKVTLFRARENLRKKILKTERYGL
jgi:RNA polymerase sigma-70 factor (ECF subfamily)